MWTTLIGAIAKPLIDLVDDLHTSDEEKLAAKQKITKLQLEAAQKAEETQLKFEQEVTKRHQADMQSDSWLARNIRPIVLLFLTIVFAVTSLTDGNITVGEFTFQMKEGYADIYETLLVTVYGFYFSSRGLQHIFKKRGSS